LGESVRLMDRTIVGEPGSLRVRAIALEAMLLVNGPCCAARELFFSVQRVCEGFVRANSRKLFCAIRKKSVNQGLK